MLPLEQGAGRVVGIAPTASELASDPKGRQGAHVAEMQRRRLLAALVEVLTEHGYEGATVGRICKRAGVSRRTFYDLYDDREACFLDALDLALARFEQRIADASHTPSGHSLGTREEASRGARGWRERIRASLAVLLDQFDTEPGLARLCVVETLKGGPEVLERRKRVIDALASAIEAGRDEVRGAGPPSFTAESLVGGAVAVIHTRLLEPDRSPLVALLNPLMSMIVLPHLGPAAARRELERPVPAPSTAVKRSNGRAAVPESDPFRDLPIRITFRTARVLATIGSQPGASNKEIGRAAGVADQGQMSKLLSRLQKAGLIENQGEGQVRGEANAWRLTAHGQGVLRAVGSDDAWT